MSTIVTGAMFQNTHNNDKFALFMETLPPMSSAQNTSLHTQTINPFMTPLIPNKMHENPYMPPHGSISTLPQIPFQAPYVPLQTPYLHFQTPYIPFQTPHVPSRIQYTS